MNIVRELLVGATEEELTENRHQYYTSHDGLERCEVKTIICENDYFSGTWERYSQDNGQTWGEWRDCQKEAALMVGTDEIVNNPVKDVLWNPVHHHYVGLNMQRIFINGHTEAYQRYWKYGENSFKDHIYLVVRKENEQKGKQYFVKYEDGDDFDINNVRNERYLNFNQAFYGNIVVLDNGDIAFPLAAPVTACCRKRGIGPSTIFPSGPDIVYGLIVARGVWNKATQQYDLSFSKPVVISDLKSSRGVDEPVIEQLESGRLIVVFRGSNISSPNWNTRIEPGTPGHKWFTYSDNEGQTFTDPVPWHYDTGEVIYSPASIGAFVKSEKSGKLFWVGNITGPEVHGNYPRFPLNIVEVDQQYGLPIRKTMTVIDTKKPEDSDMTQFSSYFYFLQDRCTGMIELYVSKIGQYSQNDVHSWRGEAWRYHIDPR